MPAVGVPAVAQQHPDLRKTFGELLRLDAPEDDFAESRRVHEDPAAGQRHHDRRDRSVAAATDASADLAGAELEARLDGVEEARLPRPRGPGHDRGAAGERRPKRGDALAGRGAGAIDVVAGGAKP